MNRFKRISGILFIITITIIVGTTIKILINDEHIIMAQQIKHYGAIQPKIKICQPVRRK